MPDRLWDYIDDVRSRLSQDLDSELSAPLKVVGHKPLGDGALPEGMHKTKYSRVMTRADDEFLLQGLARDDRVGAFLLRLRLKNAAALGQVIPIRLDLGGRLNGAVRGVARLERVKGGAVDKRYVRLKDEGTHPDTPSPLADVLNTDAVAKRLVAALPLYSEWEDQNLALQVKHGGELVGRGDHTLAQVTWVPVLSAGLSTFNVSYYLTNAFTLLKVVAVLLPDVAQDKPPTSRPTEDLEFFKDVDKLSAMGLPQHASQGREVLDHFVDLLRHGTDEAAVRPLLSADSPLRRKGELNRVAELLRLRHGKDAYRIKEVDWRYSGLTQADAAIVTPQGRWFIAMRKGDKRWEVVGVRLDP